MLNCVVNFNEINVSSLLEGYEDKIQRSKHIVNNFISNDFNITINNDYSKNINIDLNKKLFDFDSFLTEVKTLLNSESDIDYINLIEAMQSDIQNIKSDKEPKSFINSLFLKTENLFEKLQKSRFFKIFSSIDKAIDLYQKLEGFLNYFKNFH
jgi:hypothetical protein